MYLGLKVVTLTPMPQAEFIVSAASESQYPATAVPEIALYGRSNCGKSSLINFLTHRKSLVKVSSRPGVTHTVNFFMIDQTHTYADLPGYGYAQISEEQRKTFKPMIEEYFSKRQQLRLVFLLQDIRREPGDADREILQFLKDRGLEVRIVATKADKISNNDKVKALKVIAQGLGIRPEDIILTSVLHKKGGDDLSRVINQVAARGLGAARA